MCLVALGISVRRNTRVRDRAILSSIILNCNSRGPVSDNTAITTKALSIKNLLQVEVQCY